MAYDANSVEGRERAETLMRRHGEMESERANWDTLWERIAELVMPRAQQFTSKDGHQGELRSERVFDNTPSLALDKFAAATGSMLTPDTGQWHGLRATDADLVDDEEVKEYLEMAARMLFDARYAPHTNFSSQAHECWLSNGAFGNCALFVDEALGKNLRYRAMHMSQIFIGEDHQGRVDRVHRGKFKLKAYQVEQHCNDPNPARRWEMPPRVRKALDDKNPNTEFEFLHCVYANEHIDPRFADHRGMAYTSVYLSCDERMVVHQGGYRTMPYAVGRYVTGPGETYGRSPAMTVFRDILMLNEMNKSVIRQAQLTLEPPLLISDESALQPWQMQPRALNYGYLDGEGNALVQALRPEGDLMVGLEMIQDRRNAVNEAFLVTLFQILVDRPNITATEALLRAQEKGQLLGPTLGRQQSEFLSTMIERELDILSAAGVLPPMPDVLMERGGAVAIEFRSPLNKLQRADDAVGIIRGYEALAPVAAVDPNVFKRIDHSKAARIVFEASGAPADVLLTDEEFAAVMEQEQAQVDLENMAKLLPAGGKAARDIAQAEATAANIPQPIPQVQPI